MPPPWTDPMVDSMLAARVFLRERVEAALPGTRVFVGQREEYDANGNVKPLPFPHVWMRLGNESPETLILERPVNTVNIDQYGLSIAQLSALMAACNWPWGKQFPTYGNAVNPRYYLQSKTYLQEAPDRHHGTTLYAVRYLDGLQLPPT